MECVLVFTDLQGNNVVERQPTFMSAYGGMTSNIAICPTCGYPWAKCITFTQGSDGPIKRNFVGRPVYCSDPACRKDLNDWYKLPLLDNIMPVDNSRKHHKAFLHDTTRLLKIFKPELLGEPTHV